MNFHEYSHITNVLVKEENMPCIPEVSFMSVCFVKNLEVQTLMPGFWALVSGVSQYILFVSCIILLIPSFSLNFTVEKFIYILIYVICCHTVYHCIRYCKAFLLMAMGDSHSGSFHSVVLVQLEQHLTNSSFESSFLNYSSFHSEDTTFVPKTLASSPLLWLFFLSFASPSSLPSH